MVFKNHDIPNGIPARLRTPNSDEDFQVAIVAKTDPGLSACAQYNLQACQHGAGQRATKRIGAVLYDYPKAVGATPLVARTVYRRLGFETVKAEIEAGRPVIAGVNTSGFVHGPEAEHAVLIVGYNDDSSSAPEVIVNDPFDYAFYGAPNPWRHVHGTSTGRTGQYSAPFAQWTQFMPWVDAIYEIREKGTSP
jgi:hypothetical protein